MSQKKTALNSILNSLKFLYVLFFLPFLRFFGLKTPQKIMVRQLNKLDMSTRQELTVGQLEELYSRGVATNLYSGRIIGFCSEI